MIRGLHHVGVITSNIEEAIGVYVKTFDCKPARIVSVDKPGIKLRTAMLSLGISHLQLIEPQLGPGVEELKKRGEGTILEMALEVDDIEQFYDRMKALGIRAVSLTGEPIETKFLVASSGSRYFYLPKDMTRGTSIEIYQVMSD